MSLKRVATSGVKWSLVSQVGRQVMQFVTTSILARLLSPSDFGLVGMAMIVTAFIDLFKDLGTSSAVIQRKNVSDTLLHSLFWINVALGTLGMLVIFAVSPLAASFYQEPRVTLILRVLSLNLFISGISILQKARLEKKLAFKSLAKIEICAIVSASFIGIGSALLGFGVWSLVYQSLVLVTVTTVLLWVATSWRPKMIFDWSGVKGVSNYSLNLTATNVWRYFNRNADYLIIGRVLGSQDLGYYSLAYRIMLYPLQNISNVITRVMFPVFSQIQDDNAKLVRAYLKVVSLIALISFPLMIGLLAVAEDFIIVILGSQWQPVILLLMILAPVGMLQSLSSTVGTIYQAKGRTDLQFRWEIVTGMSMLTAFVIGVKWGIVGVGVAYGISSALLTYPSFKIPFDLIHLRMRDFGAVIWRPLLASLLMLMLLLGLKFWFLPTALASSWMLCILIPVGCISYLSISWYINREQIQQLLVVLKLNNANSV